MFQFKDSKVGGLLSYRREIQPCSIEAVNLLNEAHPH